MAAAGNFIDLPVERAARLVALALLEDATAARKRLRDRRRDEKALHDYRVAVRRLRTWLRAFRPWLEDSVPRKAERRLKRAAELTSESRDAEVHLEWLQAQRRAMSVRQRVGLRWLIARIEKEKAAGDRQIGGKATRIFDRARDALLPALSEYRARVDRGHDKPLSFGTALARLLRDHAKTLAKRLAKVHDVDDDRRAHAARLTAKRLRYILEPVAASVPGGTALVADLAALQGTFGDWHDGRVFAAAIVEASELAAAAKAHRLSKRVLGGDTPADAVRAQRNTDVTLGLLALAGRLHERVLSSFADAEQRWLPAATSLRARVETIAEALAQRGEAARDTDREQPRRVVTERAREVPAVTVERGYVPPARQQ